MWRMKAICRAVFSSHRIAFSHPNKSDWTNEKGGRTGRENVPKVENLGCMVLNLHTSILRLFKLVKPRLENRRGRCIPQSAADLISMDNGTSWANFVEKLRNNRGRAGRG